MPLYIHIASCFELTGLFSFNYKRMCLPLFRAHFGLWEAYHRLLEPVTPLSPRPELAGASFALGLGSDFTPVPRAPLPLWAFFFTISALGWISSESLPALTFDSIFIFLWLPLGQTCRVWGIPGRLVVMCWFVAVHAPQLISCIIF